MAIWAAIISGVIGAGVKLIGSAGGPNFPDTPKLAKIPIQKAKDFMTDYEGRRMGASIAAWKTRFPLLYSGGNYMVNDLINNQKGKLSPTIKDTLRSSGLELPIEGSQYSMAKYIGLSPITLSQRTSESATRSIADNPEWTNQVSGGTLATMIANNYQNANAFSQFLGANRTANFISGQTANANTTRALLTGLTGTARIGYQAWQNQQDPLSLGTYYQGNVYGATAPGAAAGPTYGSYSAPTYASNPPDVSVGPLEDVSGYPAPGMAGYSPAGAMDPTQFNAFYTDFYNVGTPGPTASLPYNPFPTY